MTFRSFEDRLDNWARTVRNPTHRDEACAWWAEMYVKIRDSRTGALPPSISRDELDGWLVETAWKHLPNHVGKWILRYHFVMNMGQEQVQITLWKKHKVRLRGHQFKLSLDKALTALAKEIVKITGETVIGARVDPFEKCCKREELFI